jgi:hypothetical protein
MTVPHKHVEADLQKPLWVSYDSLVYDMTADSRGGGPRMSRRSSTATTTATGAPSSRRRP